MSIIYSAVIRLYAFAVRIAAIFSEKAALMLKGRKSLFAALELSLKQKQNPHVKKPLAWFHCASLGEFEQGRPLIETFRKHYPDYLILLTFQSPSGYEVRKSYAGADLIYYLPFDTPANAGHFLNLVQPDIVFFIKYEFWFNYLHKIQKKQIPLFLVSGIFRADQHFFKWYGGWARKILKGFDMLFVQNEFSKEVLEFVGVDNVIVCGDTRFDRVLELRHDTTAFPEIEKFLTGKKTLVAGSTWEEDEEIVLKYFLEHNVIQKLIIAPHEIHASHIDLLLEKCMNKACLYSELKKNGGNPEADILIIDTIGILNKIYRFATIAYVGGGFGKGIHNILEPASYNIPVVFGPRYHKFAEAVDLIKRGGAFSFNTSSDFSLVIEKLFAEDIYAKSSAANKDYINEKTGATIEIMKYLEQNLFNQ